MLKSIATYLFRRSACCIYISGFVTGAVSKRLEFLPLFDLHFVCVSISFIRGQPSKSANQDKLPSLTLVPPSPPFIAFCVIKQSVVTYFFFTFHLCTAVLPHRWRVRELQEIPSQTSSIT